MLANTANAVAHGQPQARVSSNIAIVCGKRAVPAGSARTPGGGGREISKVMRSPTSPCKAAAGRQPECRGRQGAGVVPVPAGCQRAEAAEEAADRLVTDAPPQHDGCCPNLVRETKASRSRLLGRAC
jgi:hypothetical protein